MVRLAFPCLDEHPFLRAVAVSLVLDLGDDARKKGNPYLPAHVAVRGHIDQGFDELEEFPSRVKSFRM